MANSIEILWNKFLEDLDNKSAFSDLCHNQQMPLAERQQSFKHYLSLWAKLYQLEKGTSSQLFDYALTLVKK